MSGRPAQADFKLEFLKPKPVNPKILNPQTGIGQAKPRDLVAWCQTLWFRGVEFEF